MSIYMTYKIDFVLLILLYKSDLVFYVMLNNIIRFMITIILFEENFDHDTLYFASDLLSGKHKKKAIRELFHGLRDSRFVRLGRPFRTIRSTISDSISAYSNALC
jgi:hypothetical protein